MTKKGGGKPFSKKDKNTQNKTNKNTQNKKNKKTQNKKNPKTNVRKKRTLKNKRAEVMKKHRDFERAAHWPYSPGGVNKISFYTGKKDKGPIARKVKSPYERFNPLIYRFEGNPSELSIPKPIMSLSNEGTHSTNLGDLDPRVPQRSSFLKTLIGGKNKRKRRTNKKTRKRRTRKNKRKRRTRKKIR